MIWGFFLKSNPSFVGMVTNGPFSLWLLQDGNNSCEIWETEIEPCLALREGRVSYLKTPSPPPPLPQILFLEKALTSHMRDTYISHQGVVKPKFPHFQET
jgi:hypothetical protein